MLGPERSGLISAHGDADLNTGLEIAVTVQTTIERLANLWGPAARQRASWLIAITLRGRVRRSKLNHQPADNAYPAGGGQLSRRILSKHRPPIVRGTSAAASGQATCDRTGPSQRACNIHGEPSGSATNSFNDLPASSPRAHAPVEVFAMQEISLIERPYIRDRLSAHHHAGAGNCLDLDRVVRKRIAMQQEI